MDSAGLHGRLTICVARGEHEGPAGGYRIREGGLRIAVQLHGHWLAVRVENIDTAGGDRITHVDERKLFAAAIFAAHPLATESVTYIAGRSASLVATFYLAGLCLALRAGRAKSWPHYLFLGLSVAVTIAGLLVKQDAMTLPVASIALIWLAWRWDIPSRQRWIGTAVLAFPVVLVSSTQISSLGEVSSLTQSNTELVAAGGEDAALCDIRPDIDQSV